MGRIGAFVMLYFLIVIGVGTLLAMAGTDVLTSLSGAVSAMGNMGPALGEAGPTSNFRSTHRPSGWRSWLRSCWSAASRSSP